MERVFFRLSSSAPERTANELMLRGVPVYALRIRDGSLSFCVPAEYRDAVRAVPGATAIFERRRGPLRALWKTKGRVVLYLGLLIVIFALVLLSTHVLSIEVHGTESVPPERILADLRENGVGIFTPFWKIESRRLQNELLIREPKLRWAALNLHGTKLFVLVREEIPAPELIVPSDEPIRAKRFGIITSAVALEGNAVVEPGDTVLGGDELILPGENGAAGAVIARTFHEISAEMPLKCLRPVPEGEERVLTALFIGEKRINFYNSNRQAIRDYVTIERDTPVPFLPIGVERAVLRECSAVSGSLDAETAESILRARVIRSLNARIGSGSIVSESFSVSEEGGVLRVTVRAECREDIGE